MKLRIKGNSIRFRLLRSEVERLAANGTITEEVRFGTGTDQSLKYSIISSDGVDDVTAQFADNQILVLLPESVTLEWTSGDGVGIETSMNVGSGDELSILIEKDFECIGRPDDPDRADAFPNPSVECAADE